MKNSFFLVIPKQQNNPQRLKEFEAKSVQQWISELPAANPGLATRLMHDFVIELNTIEMPIELRLDALERLRPSVLAIQDNLRSRLIKTGFPKEENENKILSVSIAIEKELTLGYWIALKELTQRDIGWLQGKNAALAIQRCIKGLSNIVISHLLMEMTVPDWVWIDLHSLYKLSVKIKKDTTKVPDDSSYINKKSTPEECYKQILLLSLAEPAGLMQKEIPLVYRFIETLEPLIILRNKPIAGQPIQCVILTDDDKPPHFQLKASTDTDAATLYMDLTKLHKAFEHKEKLSNIGEGRFSSMQLLQSSDKPAAELLDYLEQRWSGAELESSALFDDRLDRYIAIGLASTHELKNSLDAGNDNQLEYLAESASDTLLTNAFEQTGVLSVGSLISFRKKDRRDNKRSIGIVNKIMIAKQSGKIQFGVHLLTSQFLAVTYSQLDATKKDQPQKALFYSVAEGEGETTFLITDSFQLKDGDVARMYWKSEDFPIVVQKRKNIGLGYWQFNCVKIAEKEKPAQTKKGYDFI